MKVGINIERAPMIQQGDLQIDPQCYAVRLSRNEIFLYPKAFDVLLLLAKHPGWVLSTEQIYQAVWKEDMLNCEHVVYNIICQIRKKLNCPEIIQPVLFMAGFYNRFQDEDHFIILTTQANESVSPVHHRMPLILERSELEDWVYEDTFLEFALHKKPPQLVRRQDYEQQSLFLT